MFEERWSLDALVPAELRSRRDFDIYDVCLLALCSAGREFSPYLWLRRTDVWEVGMVAGVLLLSA